MNILVIYNPDSESGASVLSEVKDILNNSSIDLTVQQFCKTKEPEIPKGTDIIIVIGGDGTIIKVAKAAARFDCPILGINAGHLGYLASLDRNDLSALKRLLDNDYTVESRCLIKAEKMVDGRVLDVCDCLNDAVISKDCLSNVIDIELTIGNDTIQYRADGIIASTPTGSTAYSLSAGGPVVDPLMKCVILTPVCPHTLVTRSMVVDGNTPIKISVRGSRDGTVNMMCDGRVGFELDETSYLSISLSDITAKFIKLNDVSVYKILSVKTDSY